MRNQPWEACRAAWPLPQFPDVDMWPLAMNLPMHTPLDRQLRSYQPSSSLVNISRVPGTQVAPNASDLIIFAWDHSPFYICPLNSGLGIISSLKVLDVPRKSLNLLLRPHNELRSFSMQVLKSPPCPAHKVTSFSPTDPLPGCFRETCNLNDATWQSCFPSDSEPPALISFYSYDTLSQARWLRTTDTHHCLTPSNF